MVKIAVLGAGINGLACAVKIKEKYPNAHVSIISKEFSPNTTGDGAAGLWSPYLISGTPPELVTKWGIETYSYLHECWLRGGLGVCFMPVLNLYKDENNWFRPHWSPHVFGFCKLNDKQLQHYGNLFSNKFGAGHTFLAFSFAPPLILDYLMQRFKRANGQVMQAEVMSLHDPILDEYDVVVNCMGLGARKVVPDDGMFSYRGQVIRVIAPWVTYALIDEDDGRYIIPNENTVVLGGTRQKNDYSTTVRDQETAAIRGVCHTFIPSLESAEVYKTWVGLRPGRDAVRLEPESRDGKLFIHNYGHGGCGLTLFWGCASHVLQILDQNVDKIKPSSKL